jgi:hypothetical protein
MRDNAILEKNIFNEAELNSLENLFRQNILFLSFILIASLLISILLVNMLPPEYAIWISITTGILGSTTAAFTSCLDRRANGFEDSLGNQSPKREDKVGRYNRGMYYWFLARPWLGAVTGAIAYWGIVNGVFTPSESTAVSLEGAAFSGFLAGLLAKSLLEILKGLLSKIFK